MEGVAGLFGIDPPPSLSTTMSSGVFQGLWGVAPAALCGGENLPSDFGDTAVLCYEVRLRPEKRVPSPRRWPMPPARKRCSMRWQALPATAPPCACTPVRQQWRSV